MKPQTKTGSILAALVHELVKAEPFDSFADLADAVKWRAARFRIPYDGGLVSEAIALVERTRPVTRRLGVGGPVGGSPDRHCICGPQPQSGSWGGADARHYSRDDATAILARLGVVVR